MRGQKQEGPAKDSTNSRPGCQERYITLVKGKLAAGEGRHEAPSGAIPATGKRWRDGGKPRRQPVPITA